MTSFGALRGSRNPRRFLGRQKAVLLCNKQYTTLQTCKEVGRVISIPVTPPRLHQISKFSSVQQVPLFAPFQLITGIFS